MTAATHVGALFSRASAALLLTPPTVEVRIDGLVEPRLRLRSAQQEMGSAPTATFEAALGRDVHTGQTVRLEDLAADIRPGAAVTATLLRGGVLPGEEAEDLVLFDGRIVQADLALTSDGEHALLEAEDPTADLLRRRLGGQRAWTAGESADRVDGRPLVFNPEGRPNASNQAYAPGSGEPYTIFAPDRPSGNIAWTLDEAVAYVLAEHGPSEAVEVPSASEVRSALPATVIRDASLEGRSLGDALEALLELAGARLVARVEPGVGAVSRRLELWYPDREPAGWLCHQPPGRAYDPAKTHFAALQVRMDFAAAPRRYVARGDCRLHESTFDLVAGWDDSLATSDPDDFSPRTNPDFDDVRDVFRKWVLNEDGTYSGPPYDRGEAPDLSDLFEGTPYVRRRRRLLPCLSRDGLGRSRGVYIEISLDGGTSWEQSTLAARVLRDECGLYLTEDPLPSRYLAAAMRGEVRVRATATVESDALLAAEYAGAEGADLPGRTRHVNVPAGYRYRRVAPTSRFYGEGGADEVDDTARLQDLIRAAWDADRRAPAPARIEVPYLALGHRVGERILGTRGRRLALAREHTGFTVAPVVRGLRLTFAPAPHTELILE
ncbi:MAG: hypothetical protein U9R68_10265 [Planctomycetota bacterium]|nr:hypothetical protein [Planctomycetota bacterium]